MDMNFNKFWTVGLVKIVWSIGVVIAGISAAISVISGILAVSNGDGDATLIIAGPAIAAFGVLVLRIWLEMVMVLFKIADNTAKAIPPPVSIGGPLPTTMVSPPQHWSAGT